MERPRIEVNSTNTVSATPMSAGAQSALEAGWRLQQAVELLICRLRDRNDGDALTSGLISLVEREGEAFAASYNAAYLEHEAAVRS